MSVRFSSGLPECLHSNLIKTLFPSPPPTALAAAQGFPGAPCAHQPSAAGMKFFPFPHTDQGSSDLDSRGDSLLSCSTS